MEKENVTHMLERGISILNRIREKFPDWTKIPFCIKNSFFKLQTHITDNHIEEVAIIDKFLIIAILFDYARAHSRKEIMEIVDVIFEKEN